LHREYSKTPEHRRKISESLTGHTRSESSKKKQSRSMSGSKNPMFGKSRSEKTKDAIRKANSKEIIYNGEQFSSVTECAAKYNVSRTTIMRRLDDSI